MEPNTKRLSLRVFVQVVGFTHTASSFTYLLTYLLFRSNAEIGAPYSSPSEWYDNQNWLQIGFYRKELPQKRRNWLTARLDEFAEGFNWFHYLDNMHLGVFITQSLTHA